MTERMGRLITLILLSLLAIGSNAHDAEIDGIYYRLNSDGTATVTYKGRYYNTSENEYTGDVIIPSSIQLGDVTYSVTNINSNTFRNCSITSISIPSSITSIGSNCFVGCVDLQKVVIEDIAAWCSISFVDNPLSYNKYPHLYLGENEIIDIVLPNSVEVISSMAFRNCPYLKSVEISNTVSIIGSSAFEGCTGITSVKIPDSVTAIGNDAFKGCTGLTSITIPSGVLTIGEGAFYNSKLKEVVIESNEFVSTTQYLYRIFGPQVETYKIGSQVKTIGSLAFGECKNLTSVELPALLTSIEGAAFWGCSKLMAISIPTTVTSIGSGAFRECSSLT